MSIALEGVTKRYAGQVTVDGVSLEVQKGELFVLLGASGSGKSTVLRLIAGLIEPDDGVIGIGSGGGYAAAAARALVKHSTLSAREIVEEAMRIAAGLCVYTNDRITVEEL